jgi:2,4-dienoyl-CoA reductase-like NADH-dependent reductase (Old Yellow Enzyme family)
LPSADRYDGSTENRTRIIREIYERARDKVGESFPILIKMNTTDLLPGGIDLDEAVRVGKLLSQTVLAVIETNGGMWEAVTRTEEELGWVRPASRIRSRKLISYPPPKPSKKRPGRP